DPPRGLPTGIGSRNYGGSLSHPAAMQSVSSPDINKTPTTQLFAPPCKNTPVPGLPEVPGAVDPKTTACVTPPRPVIWCKSSDGSEANQSYQDGRPLTLKRSNTKAEETTAKASNLFRPNN